MQGLASMIDWSINVGGIVQIIIFVCGLLAIFYGMKGDIRVIRHDVANLKERQTILNEAFTQLGNILQKVAVQDERINQQGRLIDELRHGEGFVRKGATPR